MSELEESQRVQQETLQTMGDNGDLHETIEKLKAEVVVLEEENRSLRALHEDDLLRVETILIVYVKIRSIYFNFA